MNIIGTIANNRFTQSQPSFQKTVLVKYNVEYCISKIKNKPAVFPIAEINKRFDLEKPCILNAPFTLNEFDKKKIKKKGA